MLLVIKIEVHKNSLILKLKTILALLSFGFKCLGMFIVKVREERRKKSAQKMEVGDRGEASSISQLQAVQERQTSESSSPILALPCRMINCKETLDQHVAAPLEISSIPPKGSGLNISGEEKIEKMTIPMLKEQMKLQQRELKNRVKKLSLKPGKESHKRAIGHPDGGKL